MKTSSKCDACKIFAASRAERDLIHSPTRTQLLNGAAASRDLARRAAEARRLRIALNPGGATKPVRSKPLHGRATGEERTRGTAACAAATQVFGPRCRRFPTNSARTRRALCYVHDRAACLACAHVSHWLQSCHDCDDVVFYHQPVHAREVANAAVSVGGRKVGHQCCGGGGVALRNK